MKPRVSVTLGWLSLVGVLGAGWVFHGSDDGGHKVAQAAPIVEIVIPAIVDTDEDKQKKAEEEACTSGCSLAKHAIPDFEPDDYIAALAKYAVATIDDEGEGIDTLLFYGTKTLQYFEDFGTGPLSEDHVAFLRRELARKEATVEIRFVDEDGGVRVATGPMLVPLGQKQHLHPIANSVQSMTLNGTVMRTGLYHLWSRY